MQTENSFSSNTIDANSNPSKIITREFILLFGVSVAICTAMNMLNVIIPLFVTEDLAQKTAISGFVSTTYTISSCLSRPFNGAIVDKFGRRKIMCIGALIFGLAIFAASAVQIVALLFVCRAIMGIGYSASSTANNTASTDVIPAERMSEGIGYFGMSQSIATAIGPAIAAFIIVLIGNRNTLIVTSCLCFLAILLALPINYEKKRPLPVKVDAKEAVPADAKAKKKGSMFEKTAAIPAVFQGFSLFFLSCAMCFMTLYIVSKGFASSVAGTFFMISSICIILVRLLLSRFVAKVPRNVLLVPGYVLLIVMFFLLPQANAPVHFWLLGILYGIGYGIFWMVLGSEAVRKAAPELRGAANATFYFAFDAAIGIGASTWGVLIDGIGYSSCFRLAGTGFLILGICSAVFYNRKRSM